MGAGLFRPPSNYSRIQRNLSSIFKAKSHIYGSTFFGEKKFYAEEFDFTKEPLHPNKRRQLRFGLKSLVDFIIQLDIENLKICLRKPCVSVKDFSENHKMVQDDRFPPDSFFGLMYRTNYKNTNLFFETLERITSNLNFSQSLAEYLASDGSIETTKLAITEALKKGPDLGKFLRGGPFASCAQIYKNLSSKHDADYAYFIKMRERKNFQQNDTTKRKASRSQYSTPSRYPSGYCFRFQKNGECTWKPCFFKHSCATCDSKNHGADQCRKSSKDSKKRRGSREPQREKSRSK